jgi:hypothetical protein
MTPARIRSELQVPLQSRSCYYPVFVLFALMKTRFIESPSSLICRPIVYLSLLPERVSSVMFLAGGNSKEGIKRGSKGEGLPGSIATRRGACLTRRQKGDRGELRYRGRKFEGRRTRSKRGNKFGGGTKSVFRLPCYKQTEIESMKQGNKLLPKGARRS